jgi:hypothetical protein
VEDVIIEERTEDILLFGRALEFLHVDPVAKYQMSLPLFPSNETERGAT